MSVLHVNSTPCVWECFSGLAALPRTTRYPSKYSYYYRAVPVLLVVQTSAESIGPGVLPVLVVIVVTSSLRLNLNLAFAIVCVTGSPTRSHGHGVPVNF